MGVLSYHEMNNLGYVDVVAALVGPLAQAGASAYGTREASKQAKKERKFRARELEIAAKQRERELVIQQEGERRQSIGSKASERCDNARLERHVQELRARAAGELRDDEHAVRNRGLRNTACGDDERRERNEPVRADTHGDRQGWERSGRRFYASSRCGESGELPDRTYGDGQNRDLRRRPAEARCHRGFRARPGDSRDRRR